MKIKYYIVGVIILLFVYALTSYFRAFDFLNPIKYAKIKCEEYKKLTFSGEVTDCYKDFDNKGIFTLYVASGDSVIIFPCHYFNRPQSYIEKGDSLYKPKDRIELFIYKKNYKDSTIHLMSKFKNCDQVFNP